MRPPGKTCDDMAMTTAPITSTPAPGTAANPLPFPDQIVQITDMPFWNRDARGVPTVWAIFSTPEGRSAFVDSEHGNYDYCNTWLDTNGYGVMLTWTAGRVARLIVRLCGVAA